MIRKAPLSLSAVVLCVAFITPATLMGSDLVRDHVLSFSHVVAGNLGGQYTESVLFVANPTSQSIVVELFSTPDSLARRSIALGPFGTEEVRITADTYTAGWLQVSSAEQFAADLTVVIKPAKDSETITARVDVPGQVPLSKVVTPVRVRTALALDTGIALALNTPAAPDEKLKFLLYDSIGNQIGERLVEPGYYIAMYVTELFQDLPETFNGGWMSVELVDGAGQPAEQAMALSLVSIYTGGAELLTAGATGIDSPGRYTVSLPTPDDTQVTALLDQYNLELVRHTPGSKLFTVKTTREVARSLARDQRVESVTVALYVPVA